MSLSYTRVKRSSNDLKLTLASTGEVITVQSYFSSDGYSAYRLEAIEFADGTSWGIEDVKARYLAGTDGADSLTGFSSPETMDEVTNNDFAMEHAAIPTNNNMDQDALKLASAIGQFNTNEDIEVGSIVEKPKIDVWIPGPDYYK